jgi:hypothetical protein
MMVLIRIPQPVYLGFLGRCRIDSRAYAIVRNGVVELRADPVAGNVVVEVPCSLEDAELLREHARQFYPAALPPIEEAIHRAKLSPRTKGS